MFTAEFAVGLLAVVPLLLALVSVVAAGAVQVKTAETARTAARLLARGESPAAVRAEVAAALPGAQVEFVTEPAHVQVLVSRTVGGAGLLPTWTISSKVWVPREG
jgi:hypothetical protein